MWHMMSAVFSIQVQRNLDRHMGATATRIILRDQNLVTAFSIQTSFGLPDGHLLLAFASRTSSSSWRPPSSSEQTRSREEEAIGDAINMCQPRIFYMWRWNEREHIDRCMCTRIPIHGLHIYRNSNLRLPQGRLSVAGPAFRYIDLIH